MKTKKPLAERDKQIEAEYEGGSTMQAIADKHGISRQRVEQILRSAGVERGRKRRILEIEYSCLECGKKFTSSQKERKFCSLSCSHEGRKVYKTKEAVASHRKELREYYAEKARDYYHNVFKKKKNWKQIVKERNQRRAAEQKTLSR